MDGRKKKDSGNPFAGLDPSLFPPAREKTVARPSGNRARCPDDRAGTPARAPLPPLFPEDPETDGTDAESLAFRQAVEGVTPLAGRGRAVPSEPETAPAPRSDPGNPLQDIVDGKLEFALSGSDEYLEGHVVGLDPLTVGKLQARQYSPEAHVDLHGLNSEQAFRRMVEFFRASYLKGVRTVLIVTGRGRNSPDGVPVLRSKVGQWLPQEPFRRVVLAFCTARQEDGGLGAIYVLLRKHRKNSGKIRWDSTPADPDIFP